MKQQFKQLLLTALVALCSITASAEDFAVDGIYYNYNDDGTSVSVTYRGYSYSSYKERYTGNVIIPSSVKYNKKTYNVTSIGESAFQSCKSLTAVTIPNSVTRIEDAAFMECSSLAYVPIPNSIMSIGRDAFYGCAMTSVTIPENITSIEKGAFQGCYNLTSVTIPNSVNSIGYAAFNYCKKLASITIPSNVTSIGDWAFYDCSSLARIIILSQTVGIGSSAFSAYPQPEYRVTYVSNSNITAYGIGTKVVYPSQIFTVDGLTYMITNNSDKTCRMISYDGEDTDVTVPAKVLYNGRVELTVTGVGQSAFAHNSTVQSITFNNSGRIGAYACYDCPALQSVSIGNSATSVDNYAFDDCSALTNLIIGSGITSIGSNVLDGTTLLIGVDVAKDNTTYCDIDGVICSKDGTCIVLAPKGITSYTIPTSVTRIGSYAFQGCTELTGIEVPAHVTAIGQYAFDGCTNMTTANVNATGSISNYAFQNATNLTSMTIGNNITQIGNCTFRNASKLTSLTLGNSVTSIDNYAFAGASKLTELRIPHSVTSIGEAAFSGCSALEALYLGEHLNTIGYQAFLNCTKLETITSTNVTPPTCYSEAFSGVDGTLCEVNIREEAVDAYSVAYGWKDFWFLQGYTINYIEKQPTSDDVSILMHNQKEEVTYQWYGKEKDVSNLNNLNGTGSYPWAKQSDGSWKSANNGIDNSISSMVIENLTVKSGDKLTFDYMVSSESWCDKLSVYWDVNEILSDVSGDISDSFSYTFTSNETATLEFRYSKDGSVDSGSDCATISNVKIDRGRTGAIPGATDAELDLSALSNINKVYCIVTLSDGIQLTSNTVEVSTESKPTYSVASYKGNSSAVNSTKDIDQIKAMTLQDNEMVYVDAKIGAELPTNIVKKNGEGKWVATQIELTDGQAFYNPSDVQAEVIRYNRNFTTANWQALYVPFDVQYEDWADKADVAYINDVHQFDDNGDGDIDRTTIEYFPKKNGKVKANTPYLIRPKQTGEMTLAGHNTTLKATPATGGSVDCSSTTMLYTLTGTYQTITDMYENRWYAISGGNFSLASHSGVTLSPFRSYLNITDREGNPVSDIERPSYVRLMVGGMMLDEETGIEQPNATGNADDRVYDLQGRRVDSPKHGLYIVGGKKMIIK